VVSDANLVLKTSRLLLRPIDSGDAEALWPFVSDPEVPRLMDWEAHRTPEETQTFIAAMEEGRADGTRLVWVLLEEEKVVGIMGLHGIARSYRAWLVDRADLGYWVGPPFQSKGLATEACREVLRFAFDVLKLHKVTVGCLRENEASRRVIEKIGFRFVGEQRAHVYRFGRWWDHLSYEMLVNDWLPESDPRALQTLVDRSKAAGTLLSDEDKGGT
jgi:[ribosomal protein S5]-alanine N-acetyltransferase